LGWILDGSFQRIREDCVFDFSGGMPPGSSGALETYKFELLKQKQNAAQESSPLVSISLPVLLLFLAKSCFLED
jgi:hypothetical protein